jgi:hypothetical protein
MARAGGYRAENPLTGASEPRKESDMTSGNSNHPDALNRSMNDWGLFLSTGFVRTDLTPPLTPFN